MKYCKKCGLLYTTELCPGCGIVYPDKQPERQLTPAESRQQKRQWIALLIGIPAMIGAIYLILTLLYS